MESLQTKTPRKRVANFTADEKTLLAQLIKNRKIVGKKITDFKSIAKKREAVLKIRNLENRKNMEMQILKTQLEVVRIKKKSALLEEERNKILLEKAKIELEELKKFIAKQSS